MGMIALRPIRRFLVHLLEGTSSVGRACSKNSFWSDQCFADAVLRFAQYAFILWDAAFLAAEDIPRL
jgi:hypothetical protein